MTSVGRASPLTRESIIAAALSLLDEVGYEGLTTRRLAQELSVRSPALYWHFRSKRELSDALALAMVSPHDWPGPDTAELGPPEWLAARAHAFREALLAHRDGAVIHAGTSPNAELLPGLDEQIAALVAYGFSPEGALSTLQAVSRYTVGWVLEEQAAAHRKKKDGEDGLSHGSALGRAGAIAAQVDPKSAFAFGLRALITGAMQHRTDEISPAG